MLSIYKFTFNPEWSVHTTIRDYHIVEFLSAQLQEGKVTVWAIVDTKKENNLAEVFISGTGWTLSDDNRYWCNKENFIDTVQDDWGLVWHVFGFVHPTKANHNEETTQSQEVTQAEEEKLDFTPTKKLLEASGVLKATSVEDYINAFNKAYDIVYKAMLKEAEKEYDRQFKEQAKAVNNQRATEKFSKEHPSRANAREHILKNI